MAAAKGDVPIHALVSRGGRPDLAEMYLGDLTIPTLLIVGSRDDLVLRLNQSAFEQIRCEKKLYIVDGATHLFEVPGTLDEVSVLAREWFLEYLPSKRHGSQFTAKTKNAIPNPTKESGF